MLFLGEWTVLNLSIYLGTVAKLDNAANVGSKVEMKRALFLGTPRNSEITVDISSS